LEAFINSLFLFKIICSFLIIYLTKIKTKEVTNIAGKPTQKIKDSTQNNEYKKIKIINEIIMENLKSRPTPLETRLSINQSCNPAIPGFL